MLYHAACATGALGEQFRLARRAEKLAGMVPSGKRLGDGVEEEGT